MVTMISVADYYSINIFMKFHRKTLHILFFLLFFANIVWDLWLYTFPTKTTIWHYLFNLTYGLIYLTGGVVSIAYGFTFGLKSNLGKMLLFLGLGLLTYEIGSIIWVYYNLVLKVAIPFPSFADASYVLFYPVTGIGCYYLLRLYNSLINKRLIRDSVIIIIISMIATFGFFAKPDLSAHLSLIQKTINLLYTSGDVILLSMALIALRIGGGKLHPSLFIFSCGLFIFSAADFSFIYRNANSTYWNGDIADLLYTSGGYVLSVGLFEVINSLNHAHASTVKEEPEKDKIIPLTESVSPVQPIPSPETNS